MSINRENYEIWFLDHFEGRLSKSQEEQLFAFLELHYDLKEEFELFENVPLPAEEKIVFEDKNSLRKESGTSTGKINEKNYMDFVISRMEGDISNEDDIALTTFLDNNTAFAKEAALMGKARIVPDLNIIYPLKDDLKKPVVVSVDDINESNYAEYFIAAIEGDLPLHKREQLKEFMNKNPRLYKEYRLFGLSKLTVDTAIAFNRKEQLKKKQPRVFNLGTRRFYYTVSAAASILILLSIYLLFPGSITSNPQMAEFRVGNKAPKKVTTINNSDISPVDNVIYGKTRNNQAVISNNNSVYINELTSNDVLSANHVAEVTGGGRDEQEVLKEQTMYRDFYTMMLDKRRDAEAMKQQEDKSVSLKDFALFRLKRSLAPEDKKDEINPGESKFSLWDVADAGVQKFNELTGADARLQHGSDSRNFLFAVGDKFGISRSGRNK